MTSTHTLTPDFPALVAGTVVERGDGFRYLKIGASTWQLLDGRGDYNSAPTRYDDSQMTYTVDRDGARYRIVLEPEHGGKGTVAPHRIGRFRNRRALLNALHVMASTIDQEIQKLNAETGDLDLELEALASILEEGSWIVRDLDELSAADRRVLLARTEARS